jgi:hypothetical protein
MSRSCDRKAIEALVYGELPAADVAEVTRHAASCEDCGNELAWLRIERGAMAERASQQPELPAQLWQGIEQRIAERAGESPASPSPVARLGRTLFPWRGERARWLGFGLAATAIAAAVLLVVVQRPGGGGPTAEASVDAGVERDDPTPNPEPAPDQPRDRMAEAERAVEDAEAAELAAIAALDAVYEERRASLAPDVAARYDAELTSMRDALAAARESTGTDVESRVRLLGAYSKHRRGLQAVVYGLEEKP